MNRPKTASTSRKPPLPHWNAGKGICRWCGEPSHSTKTGRPTLWHPDCVEAYLIATGSAKLRKAIFARDKGFCARCGCHYNDATPVILRAPDHSPYEHWRPWMHTHGQKWKQWTPIRIFDGPAIPVEFWTGWDADHITPLHLVDRTLPWNEAIWFWSIDNVQTLCLRCHRSKTTLQASRPKRSVSA